ncbi:replicative helicase loader/inhibitor, partial [Hungatella sp. SL.1.14]|uniref:replicative helicase loader/inhibitor n=1 Tax=Hungatella sp. SL.1.14 TaxID=2963703 RepID=UPI00210B8BB7
MNTKEFAVFADRIKTSYPKYNLLATGDQMDWWYELLGDIPFQVAIIALKKYALSNKFPPAISHLRLYAADLMET